MSESIQRALQNLALAALRDAGVTEDIKIFSDQLHEHLYQESLGLRSYGGEIHKRTEPLSWYSAGPNITVLTTEHLSVLREPLINRFKRPKVRRSPGLGRFQQKKSFVKINNAQSKPGDPSL